MGKIMEAAVKKSDTRMCSEIAYIFLMDGSGEKLELRRIGRDVMDGNENLRVQVEYSL